jgi:hypothetical protein
MFECAKTAFTTATIIQQQQQQQQHLSEEETFSFLLVLSRSCLL